MNRLEGKAAIVTGGASGIGEAIVLAFLAEGARVLATDLRPGVCDEIAASPPQTFQYLQGDVSDEEHIKACVHEAERVCGRLDIVVNCAGYFRQGQDVTEASIDDFDRMMAVNVKGPWLMHRHSIPVMLKTGGGSIINIGSVGGLRGLPGHSAYGASKGAVDQMTRSVGSEFADRGIRVNTIAPGSIFTPMSRAQRPSMTEDEARESMAQSTIVKRTGMPRDIAMAAVFLASDESSFITGQTLAVDGGGTTLRGRKPANATGGR